MHQDHNLHWDQVAANFKFIKDNKHLTPSITDCFPRNLPSQAKSLTHFSRVFARTLCEFSQTERAKYPSEFPAPRTGKVFPDELVLAHWTLTSRHQDLSHWIEQALPDGRYTTSHGQLADAVKCLIAGNQLEPLLMLANHPDIPLADLQHLSWGHGFGVDFVADHALLAYLFLNITTAVLSPSQLEQAYLMEMSSYRHTLSTLCDSCDYDAQCEPHRDFFCPGQLGVMFYSSSRILAREKPHPLPNPLAHLTKLEQYLKRCWALMYRYDMLMRECGREVDWEAKVAQTLNHLWGVNTAIVEREETGMGEARFRYTTVFV